jgi:ligand-binding SRPBCC domain-containing protein
MVSAMRHSYTIDQWVAYPVELVFAFFANPHNLPHLLPRWQSARIEELQLIPPPIRPQAQEAKPRLRSIAAGAGSTITISFRPFPFSPIRLPWEAHISEFIWNDHFCDQQRRGPFAYWKHCHRVEEETRNQITGTLVTDDVTYEMKLGAAGELAHTLFVKAQMRRIFSYRQQRLEKIFARIIRR